MKKRKKFLLIITAFIILLGGIYGGLKEWTGASSNIAETTIKLSNRDITELMALSNIQQLAEPVEPPNFSLMSVAEEQIDLKDQHGKVVLLSFWATW